MKLQRVLFFNPPSPPFMNVGRDWAGGMGIASPSIRPTYGHDTDSDLVPYMSLLHCAAILENAGYSVSFLDGQAERYTLEDVKKQVQTLNSSIVVVAINLPSIYGDLKLAQEIKNILPTLKIIGIGTVCKVPTLAKLILESKAIDFIILGDAEIVLLDLINALENNKNKETVRGIAYWQNNNVIMTQQAQPLKNLDSLPFAPYHLLPMDKYWTPAFGKKEKYMMIYSTRGCPFKCAYYCPYPLGFGKKVIFRNPFKTVDEIQFLREKYGVRAILFRDQNFTINKTHASQICDELIKRKLNIRWLCETRLNLVDEAMLKKMKEAGCEEINFGFETGDPELFEKIGKPAGGDLDNAATVITAAKKIGIKVVLHVMVGLPGENWQRVKKTLNCLKKWRGLISGIGIAIATPYPGTKFYEDAKKKNLILTENWSKYTGYQPVMKTEHFTVKELLKAQKFIEDNFYFEGNYEKMKNIISKTCKYLHDGTFFKRLQQKITLWFQYLIDPNKV